MGLVKNISIIGLVAALSFYGTEAAVTLFTKPATADTVVAGKVTTGVVGGDGTTTTAEVMILENTALADGVVATVTATSGASTTVTYATTTTSTIFAIDSTTGVITVSGTNKASVSNSPYTFVVEATDADAAKGTVTITINVNGVPSFTSPTTCWYIADEAPTSTTLGTYTASIDSGETITYSIDSGNTGTAFTTPMAAGKLVTASKMAKATTPKYTLVLHAVDSAPLPGTGSTTVTVSVQDAGTTTQACGTAGLLGSLLIVMAVLVAQFM